MYIYELVTETDSLASGLIPKLSEKMDWLAEVLHRHGHLVHGNVPVPFKDGQLRLLLNLVTPDALEARHLKSYVKTQWDEIEALAGQQLVLNWLGNEIPEEPWGPAEPCTCSQSSYILDGERAYSPVACLECDNFVPLYTLPETKDDVSEKSVLGEGYDDIYFWRQQFRACKKLWFQGLAEPVMVEMLNKFDSELAQRGIKITRRIEFLTGKPTYYILMNVYETDSEEADGIPYERAIQRRCPSCDQSWFLPEPLHTSYHFQCRPCRLMAELPSVLL